jgi:HlyD family secretion protein
MQVCQGFRQVLVLATLFIIGCSAKEAPYYQGYVEVELVYLASSRQGVLNNLFAAKGQSVQQGETVFELDPNPEALQVVEMHHRIQQASAQLADLKKGERPSELATIQSRLTKAREALALAKRDLKRRQELDKLGGSDTISEEELDRFQTEVNLRQADAVAIEAELNTARLGGRTDAIVARESEVERSGCLLESVEMATPGKKSRLSVGWNNSGHLLSCR